MNSSPMDSITEKVARVGGRSVITASLDPALDSQKENGEGGGQTPKGVGGGHPKKTLREAEIKNELYSPSERLSFYSPY